MTERTATTTAPTTSRIAPVQAVAAVVGGLTATVLGTSAALSPGIVGPGWFVTAGIMAMLFTLGIVRMRRTVDRPRTTRLALGLSAVAMALFALAHFSAIADEDTGVILFSVFMIAATVPLVVAGVAAIRAHAGTSAQRVAMLLTGIWPLATIPAGAAIGDVPQFLAIALWGVCWIVFGLSLVARRADRTIRTTAAA